MTEQVIDFLDIDPALPTCPSCDCELHDDDRANQPQVDICHQLVCQCHAAYWDQLGELDKRWMWGDR